MAQQSSSSSPSILRYTYDVFLSFRGEDTRFGFTGNLYSALSQRGIFTFIDDDALRKGEEITPSLSKAIQESRMSIIIFSERYATSTFCLNELVQIHECYTKQEMRIFPVFYDIDPSHVRHQKGSYKEALEVHELGRFKDDIEKVKKWRLALRQVADLSGWHFKIGEEYESDFIKKITEEVSSKLHRSPLHIADYPVGLKARMEKIQRLMGAEFYNKVTMLGIHGMGGVGKSTLARAMYNLIAHQFEASCFLANVREKSVKDGLEHIQEIMLSELVGERNIKLGDVYRGIPILQQRLCRKKVLLVLDDINNKEQLQATAGGLDWFGLGSVIIITTRDKHLLDIHRVEKLYKVNELDDNESLQLFSWNAFKNTEVDPNYKESMKRAIHYASGLPLALEIIGSNLLGKALDEWDSALKAYERIPNRNVQAILRVSYDNLEHNEKEIFLDIACFFSGCSLRYVTNILEARGFYPSFNIGVLLEKSLIKIYRYNREIVIMHNLVQSMGREVVRQQSTSPHKRNRLWLYEDIVCVLEKNRENDEIEAIMLDMPEDEEMHWNQKVFGKMKNLRMMVIRKNGGFLRIPKVLPNSLRVLEWWGYPAVSLPSNFHSRNLVILNLSYSKFQWDKPLENLKVLRRLILRGCKNITQIPDMSGFPNLIEFYVGECTNLIEIHDSVGYLHNLQRFNAEGCTKLKIIPCGIKMTSLEFLSLQDCSSLVKFPEVLEPMHKLEYLNLDGTAMENMSLSIANLKAIRFLSIKRCQMLDKLSDFLQILPAFCLNLKELYLQGSNLTILPESIEECHSLDILELSNCKNLQKISGLPSRITEFSAANTQLKAKSLNKLLKRAIDSTSIRFSIHPGRRVPKWFDHSKRGNTLDVWFRKEFPSLTVCAVTGTWDNVKPPFFVKVNFFVKINDMCCCVFCFGIHDIIWMSEDSHIIILYRQRDFRHSSNSDFGRALRTNEWIHGTVSLLVASNEDSSRRGVIKWTGVYVNQAFSRMEDIQFTDPNNLPNNTSDVGSKLVLIDEESDVQVQQQQQQSEIVEQPLNYVASNSDSHEPACTIDRSNDQDGEFSDYQATNLSFTESEMQNVKAQREIGRLKSEVSREFTHQNKDYIEGSEKIESTEPELNELATGLETKKKQFSKAMALVNELQQKLNMTKKMKEDLGEKLSAINANISAIEANHSSIKAIISSIKADISASQSERNMDRKRIRNIIMEGNTDMNQS